MTYQPAEAGVALEVGGCAQMRMPSSYGFALCGPLVWISTTVIPARRTCAVWIHAGQTSKAPASTTPRSPAPTSLRNSPPKKSSFPHPRHPHAAPEVIFTSIGLKSHRQRRALPEEEAAPAVAGVGRGHPTCPCLRRPTSYILSSAIWSISPVS